MRAFENHIQWPHVKEATRRLKEAGFEALLAGGCVRDLLMNREPNDFDIATDATPDQVEALFPRSLAVGKAFGVIILPHEGFQLEIATFREDLEYKDGRRPEGVRFSTAEADSKRRDFTVNALFYDIDSDRIIDYVGGEADIKKKTLRTVGDADKRFDEDKLRILRAVRFAAQLDFDIHPGTLEAILRRAPEVSVVSRERIRDELSKLLKTRSRLKGLGLLLSSGLVGVLFPELAEEIFKRETKWLDSFHIESIHVPTELTVSLALFVMPAASKLGDRGLREFLTKSLKLDNKQADAIVFSIKNLPSFLNPSQMRRGELALLLSKPEAKTALRVASVVARLDDSSISKETDREAYLAGLKAEIMPTGELPAPFLNGESAKVAGLKPGPTMGRLLNESYLLQLEGKLRTAEEALEWLKESSH